MREKGMEREGKRTARMSAQHVTNSFSIRADALNARNKVAAVALEEDAVFGPVVVDVVLVPDAFERGVGCGFGVED
jgi:hypothetical protein